MSKYCALLIALIAPIAAHAAGDDNTSPPAVITSPTTDAPQTPAYPPPPIGADIPGVQPITPPSVRRPLR
jgi:hypothetical protein